MTSPSCLEECTFKNTPRLRPDVEGKDVIPVRIVDGDTMWVAYEDHDGQFFMINCRLMGLDTAEVHSKDPIEKQAGLCGKQHLIDMVDGQRLRVTLEPRSDKYGRWLGSFTRLSDGLDVNKDMLDTWAVPYDGGTKNKDFDWASMLEKNGVSSCQE